jgi:hypothetical protein
LARLISDPRDQLLFSRSPRDVIRLLRDHPVLRPEVIAARPALGAAASGEEALRAALDAERGDLIRRNEAYAKAVRSWRDAWPEVERETRSLPLLEAHATIVSRALSVLPFEVSRDG